MCVSITKSAWAQYIATVKAALLRATEPEPEPQPTPEQILVAV